MTPRMRQTRFGPVGVNIEGRADGCTVLRNPDPLRAYPERLTDRLDHWAAVVPDRTFLARRDKGGDWRRLSYAETLAKVRVLGQALLDRGLSAERPIVILSENDLEHALLGLAALHVGILHAPVSPPYSLVSSDFGKLRHVLQLMRPGLVFAASGERYGRAIAAAVPADAELVVTEAPPEDRPATLFSDLLAGTPTAAVAAAHARLDPDAATKIMFTSGSTGMPKGVIDTQRMLASNLQQIVQSLAFLEDGPPLIVDWLPWNHTFGGNHNVGIILYAGGTLYIDDGKPVPGLFAETVRNLRELAPTVYFNVPKAFEMLLPYLRAEPELRRLFFSRLQMIFYAAAALPQHIWHAFDQIAVETCGERIPIISGLGATETAPFATCCNWPMDRSGLIGLPASGLEVKLVPNDRKLEVRVRGPNVTPGYWRQDALTRAAFDEEGFYRMGDAARFVDPARPELGLEFDGRISEDFKLTSGTWVSVGPLRARFIAHFAPYVRDVVIAGHDRDSIAAIAILDIDNCRPLCPDLGPRATLAEVANASPLRRRLRELLGSLLAHGTGSATRIERMAVLDEAPSLDAGEITDKGSINQRAVLDHRAAVVDDLYADRPSSRVIAVDSEDAAHVA